MPLERLQLLEGQDMVLVSGAELLSGTVWSSRLQEHPPLVDGLQEVMGQSRFPFPVFRRTVPVVDSVF